MKRNKLSQNEKYIEQDLHYKFCDKTHPRQKKLYYPAYEKICSKDGKPNHFSTVCMSAADSKNLQRGKPTKKTTVR